MKTFLEEIPPPGLYGFKDQTLQSLLLAHVKTNRQKDGLVDYIITVSPGGIPIITALENYVLKSAENLVSKFLHLSIYSPPTYMHT